MSMLVRAFCIDMQSSFDGIDVVIYFGIVRLHFGGLFLFLSLFLFPLGGFLYLPEKGFSCF